MPKLILFFPMRSSILSKWHFYNLTGQTFPSWLALTCKLNVFVYDFFNDKMEKIPKCQLNWHTNSVIIIIKRGKTKSEQKRGLQGLHETPLKMTREAK